MDRGTILLQGLRAQLAAWFSTIQRTTGATEVVAVAGEQPGDFVVHVTWQPKGQEPTYYERRFTRETTLMRHGHSPLAWRVEKRACDYARDIMREVLQRRGV